jgi:alpha-beta hydrolase superfamily lysophospholipase
MPETEFTLSDGNNTTFHAVEWTPDGEPQGLIVLIHGLSDHGGRYRHVGAFFAAAGYALILIDLRGHGLSSGKRGHFPSFNVIMDDISLFLDEARRRHPVLPIVLYGHSMGGNLVLNYLIRKKPPIAGAVVTSPWLRLTFKPPLFKIILARLVNRIIPSITQPDGLIPSYLSRDEKVAKDYIADPLVHSRISVSTFLEISYAGEEALKHADKIACPLLLMHGTNDSLTSFAASNELSKKLVSNHTFKAWEGYFHELHNEFEKEAVLDCIREWLDTALGRGIFSTDPEAEDNREAVIIVT